TTGPVFCLVRVKEGTPDLNRQNSRRPFALQLPSYRKTWTGLRESAQIPVDDLIAGEQADHPTEGEERAEGDGLLARRRPMASDERQAEERAGGKGDQQRRGDGPPQVEAHHGRQLHVAH